MLSALVKCFQTCSPLLLLWPPRWYCYLRSPRRNLGLGDVEQTFRRRLCGVMPAFVSVDAEMNEDPASDLEGLTVQERVRCLSQKCIKASVEICVGAKNKQVERDFPEAQRYRGRCAEDGQGAASFWLRHKERPVAC